MSWITQISPVNLIILGFVSLCAVFIFVKNVASFKFGKAEVKVSSDEKSKEDRKIFVEIMNFSWKLNQELSDGEHFYKKQARREIKDHLYAYEILVKSAYKKVLMEKNPSDYKLTYSSFAATLDGQFYMKLMQILMDCYEHNHITTLSEPKLREKSEVLYWHIVGVFKEHFQEPWLEEMCDYFDLQKACQSIENDVKEMLFDTMKDIQQSLIQLYKMRTAIQNVRNSTSAWIIENGLLPAQAESMVETFFEPVKGLNVDRVNEYLELIRI